MKNFKQLSRTACEDYFISQVDVLEIFMIALRVRLSCFLHDTSYSECLKVKLFTPRPRDLSLGVSAILDPVSLKQIELTLPSFGGCHPRMISVSNDPLALEFCMRLHSIAVESHAKFHNHFCLQLYCLQKNESYHIYFQQTANRKFCPNQSGTYRY